MSRGPGPGARWTPPESASVGYPIGENLLAPKRRLGFGLERIVGQDFIAEISNKVIIHPLPGQPPPAGDPDPEDLRRLYNAWCGLSWWRIMKGNTLPAVDRTRGS